MNIANYLVNSEEERQYDGNNMQSDLKDIVWMLMCMGACCLSSGPMKACKFL